MTTRRTFIKTSAALAAGLGLTGLHTAAAPHTRAAEPLFRISLAEWSLHNTLFDGKLDNLDFPATAKRLGAEGVEYVNQFFMDRAQDMAYLRELKDRAESEGVRNVLIMCDREGDLGDADAAKRLQAVENHYKWVDAAQFLGCHSIRVNARGEGTYEEQQQQAADGLRRLCEYADAQAIDVLVENHGGLSSNGRWLVGVMQLVDHPRVGTLPDFGNFRIREDEWYDRYQGVREMMPYAKAVSAKSAIDAEGNTINTDYRRMMQIVLDAGYRGYVGIESGSDVVSEEAAILATRRLLERVRDELAAVYQAPR